MRALVVSGATLSMSLLILNAAAAQGRGGHHGHPSVEITIDRAVAAYAKVRTLRATFEQTLTNPLTGTTSTARGDFRQKRPRLLAVRFTHPDGDRIVADGESVWIYLPTSSPGQVIRSPMGSDAGAGFDLTARFLDSPRARYTLTDAGAVAIGGRPAHGVHLLPRTDQPFVKATVWIDDADASIRQFEVVEGSGLVRRVRLTTLAINVPLERRAFLFTPPNGVRVIDQTALMGGR
ncbi:MAG: hypothetical protein NVS1B4_12010 [Gemmatimonadaceae bacterium]